MRIIEFLKSVAFWLSLIAVLCLVSVSSEAAKKKVAKDETAKTKTVEKKKAGPAEQAAKLEAVKEYPEWTALDNGACIGLNMPIVVKGERRLVPMKCCADLSDPTKDKFPYTCELGPWVKDQSKLPKAVEPPKG